MAYPDDGDPKRLRVLEALRVNMAAIATPQFHHDVRVATIFEGRQITVGTYFPAIVIVPIEDNSTGTLSCSKVVHLMQVAIVGGLKYVQGSEDWKTQAHFLITDIQHAITDDLQLGGLATYVEPNTDDVFDNVEAHIAVVQTITTISYRHDFANPSV